MKYIRTNYGGIVKCKQNEYNEWCYDFLGFPQIMPTERIVKIADTIEELCDFIVEMKDNKISHIVDIREHKTNWNCFLHSNDKYAIETNKGLIYVAKMNGKGELELL